MYFAAGARKPGVCKPVQRFRTVWRPMSLEQQWQQDELVAWYRVRCSDVQGAGGARFIHACMRGRLPHALRGRAEPGEPGIVGALATPLQLCWAEEWPGRARTTQGRRGRAEPGQPGAVRVGGQRLPLQGGAAQAPRAQKGQAGAAAARGPGRLRGAGGAAAVGAPAAHAHPRGPGAALPQAVNAPAVAGGAGPCFHVMPLRSMPRLECRALKPLAAMVTLGSHGFPWQPWSPLAAMVSRHVHGWPSLVHTSRGQSGGRACAPCTLLLHQSCSFCLPARHTYGYGRGIYASFVKRLRSCCAPLQLLV